MIKKRQRLKNRDKSRDYVDGPTFQKNLIEWYESGKEEIPITIVNAVMQIINRLATKGIFNGYSFLEEMKGDAIIVCISALNNKKYDPYRYDNPFAYFTRVAWNAFINQINIEQKEAYLKQKSLVNHYQDVLIHGSTNDSSEYSPIDNNESDLIERFERKQRDKKRTKIKAIEEVVLELGDDL